MQRIAARERLPGKAPATLTNGVGGTDPGAAVVQRHLNRVARCSDTRQRSADGLRSGAGNQVGAAGAGVSSESDRRTGDRWWRSQGDGVGRGCADVASSIHRIDLVGACRQTGGAERGVAVDGRHSGFGGGCRSSEQRLQLGIADRCSCGLDQVNDASLGALSGGNVGTNRYVGSRHRSRWHSGIQHIHLASRVAAIIASVVGDFDFDGAAARKRGTRGPSQRAPRDHRCDINPIGPIVDRAPHFVRSSRRAAECCSDGLTCSVSSEVGVAGASVGTDVNGAEGDGRSGLVEHIGLAGHRAGITRNVDHAHLERVAGSQGLARGPGVSAHPIGGINPGAAVV